VAHGEDADRGQPVPEAEALTGSNMPIQRVPYPSSSARYIICAMTIVASTSPERLPS